MWPLQTSSQVYLTAPQGARVKLSTPLESSNLHTAFLHMILSDEKQMAFDVIAEAAYLALMLVVGAADTSRMSTSSFLDTIMCFPEVQETAQTGLDRAVPDHLPQYPDLKRIPYI